MGYAIAILAGVFAGIGFMISVIAVLRIMENRRKKVRKRQSTENTETHATPMVKRSFEFSKIVLLCVMVAYFFAVGVGIKLSLIDYNQYSVLAMLVGAPTATAIGFYAWKAKAENAIKIKNNNPGATDGISVDLNNIHV